jgi:hypothetical protein
MGFAIQLLSNGASRLIYMYLLGVLNQLDVHYATPHAALLTNTNGLCALFSLNAFQYYIARKTPDIDADLRSCQTQFKLLVTLWVTTLACMALLGPWEELPWLKYALPTVAAAVSLALPEITFTMATARDKAWKSILFYGGQSIFFGGYALAIIRREGPMQASLYASVPTVLVNLIAYQALQRPKYGQNLRQALAQLGKECHIRLSTLIASLPIIAAPSAMVSVMEHSPETAAQIPQMLLFSSFAGALVFVMGNFFQHYGKDLIPKLLEIQRRQNHLALLGLVLGVFVLCTVLTMPVELLLTYARHSFQHDWARNWYINAAITATGAVILQWYTVICMHHGDSRTILWSNIAYLLLAIALTATTVYTGIHIFTILAICAALRSLVNIAGFSSASGPSWRT